MSSKIELLDEFVELIYKRIEEKIDKKINNSNVELVYTGTVSGTDPATSKCKVNLPQGETEYLLNLSGETLEFGDKVKVFSDKSNLVNAYIGVAFK